MAEERVLMDAIGMLLIALAAWCLAGIVGVAWSVWKAAWKNE